MRELEQTPPDRAVAVLLRHAERDALPPDEVGYDLPITDAGRRAARALGARLRGRLRTLHASPLPRCVQTAEAVAAGAQVEMEVAPDRLLGDPGAFVIDATVALENWRVLGHDGVMHHLVTESAALPGMARPDKAARVLVDHLLAVTGDRPGVHIFVSHDLLVTATAARLLGLPLGRGDWPGYLEGAFFWRTAHGIEVAYRGHHTHRTGSPRAGDKERNP